MSQHNARLHAPLPPARAPLGGWAGMPGGACRPPAGRRDSRLRRG